MPLRDDNGPLANDWTRKFWVWGFENGCGEGLGLPAICQGGFLINYNLTPFVSWTQTKIRRRVSIGLTFCKGTRKERTSSVY